MFNTYNGILHRCKIGSEKAMYEYTVSAEKHLCTEECAE